MPPFFPTLPGAHPPSPGASWPGPKTHPSPPPSPPRAPRAFSPPPAWADLSAAVVAAPSAARPAPLPVEDPVVHFTRPLPGVIETAGGWLGGGRRRVEVTISTADPATGAAALAAALTTTTTTTPAIPPWLPPLVAADAATAAALIASSMAAVNKDCLPPTTLAARLELIDAPRCPRFHCDSVGLRALVTYCGPGTLYVPESAVGPRVIDRHDGFSRPVRGGERVDAGRAVRAGTGDVVFLGGHLRAGGHGGGGAPPYPAAVHQSPPVPEGVVRLVLTVDDAVPATRCGGCEAC